jgi:F-type H+/Na+-transporting ATPase subunit beta
MATDMKEKTQTAGKVVQVVGVVVDVEFESGRLPAINYALKTKLNGKDLLLEVAQHLSETVVRTVSLASTDGLKRNHRRQRGRRQL